MNLQAVEIFVFSLLKNSSFQEKDRIGLFRSFFFFNRSLPTNSLDNQFSRRFKIWNN